MKFVEEQLELDSIDLGILAVLQEDCRVPLARIGERVGLSAPSVLERIKKLEENEVLRGYHAEIDAKAVGLDITAFIGVSTNHPQGLAIFEKEVDRVPGILECHHVTGAYTMLLKVKTENTDSLERLISHLRAIEGVVRTETMVVLSTHAETTQLTLRGAELKPARKGRRNGERRPLAAAGGK